MDNKKLEETVIKLAKIAKKQAAQIKKLATENSGQQLSFKVVGLGTLQGMQIAGANVRLEGNDSGYEATVTVSVKGLIPNEITAKDTVKKLVEAEALKLNPPLRVEVTAVTFVKV